MISSLLQVLGFALLSFGVLVFLTSYLRYRKMQLQAMDQVGLAMSPSDAVMLILGEMREKKGDTGLLRIDPGPDGDMESLERLIEKSVRRQDQIFRLENGPLIVVVFCPPENLDRVGKRLLPILMEAGYASGVINLLIPDFDAQHILEWMESGPEMFPEQGWNVLPDPWEFSAPDPVSSPAVDELTGVLKADRVQIAFRRLVASQRRSDGHISLVRLDIDQLESYNQSFGRETGDRILKQAATLLLENCRETDLIGRVDGDAFVLAMVGEEEDLLSAVRRMSDCIKDCVLDSGEHQIRFSAAFGLASMPKDGRNPALLLECAEWAMQEAKRRGRGMCVAYQPSLKPAASAAAAGENRPESF